LCTEVDTRKERYAVARQFHIYVAFGLPEYDWATMTLRGGVVAPNRMHIMNKSALLCSLTCFGLMLTAMPPASAAAEKFGCPLAVKPTMPAKLQEIQRLLPDDNAMADIGRLNATIGALLQDGMSKSQIIDHLVGVYCP
jgi:hypothetical protein